MSLSSSSSVLLLVGGPIPRTTETFRSKSCSNSLPNSGLSTRATGVPISTASLHLAPASSPCSPRTSRSSARHAKCLKPISYPIIFTGSPLSTSKLRMRKQSKALRASGEPVSGGGSKSVLLPGTAPIAQIRSLPLHISQIRSFERSGPDRSGQRSSYIINSSKVRNVANIKRSRSLSPEILRNTGSEPLQSPILVRSAVVLSKKPHKTATQAGSKTPPRAKRTIHRTTPSPDAATRGDRETGTREHCNIMSASGGPSSSSSLYSTYNLVKGRNNRFASGVLLHSTRLRVNKPTSATQASCRTGSPTPNNITPLLSPQIKGTGSTTTLTGTTPTQRNERETKEKAATTTKTTPPAPFPMKAVSCSNTAVKISPCVSDDSAVVGEEKQGGLLAITTQPYFPVTSTWPKYRGRGICGGGSSNTYSTTAAESLLEQRQFPKALEHQKLCQRHHEEELSVVSMTPEKRVSKEPSSHLKLFGSHLLLGSGGGGSGGGGSSGGSNAGGSSRHHHHHHHQTSSRSNGPSGRRTLKMDMQSPTSARVGHPNTNSHGHHHNHNRSFDGSGYPPGIYANHPKPLAYYRNNSGSVASSIYSEPIHRSHPQPYKQGLFGGQRGTLSRQPPPSSTLFDDDPGIMSEAETSSTGFRRGGKARSSLPVVRTPSKTLERPLGMVFLQYRSETKRALLPNEITSMDTVKALFVRSFPKQLTMEYLDAMNVKIYIHDGAKDMFYELEDLRDIRDRSVLRLFEPNINGNGSVPSWDQDQSYFSEPEFDSDYQHQHIHKTKGSKGSPYNMTYSYPVGATLPRVTRSFSPAPVPIKAEDPTYVASPERRFMEDPYYQFPPPRSGSITPVIIDEEARVRMEHMERQLANLTGLVQKALVTGGPPVTAQPTAPGIRPAAISTLPRNIVLPPGASQNAVGVVAVGAPPPISSLYRDYIPTRDYRVEKPTKPAIKSSTLPRMSQDRVLKPVPSSVPKPPNNPVQPPVLVNVPSHPYDRQYYPPAHRGDLGLSPEMYNQLRMLQKKAKELKTDIKFLRRSVQAQAHTVRETLRDTFLRFKVVTMSGSDQWMQGDPEKSRIRREEELYKQEVMKLEKDLSELELTVEELRGHVINKRTRVNMSDVENMALILSKSSKSVADLKVRFPPLHESVKTLLTSDMDRMAVEEQFLKEEPERLESALKRCKKLTGTLVTLKRLASVQEQRLPSQEDAVHFPPPQSSQIVKTNNREPSSTTPSPASCPIVSAGGLVGAPGFGGHGGNGSNSGVGAGCPENALDDLLNEISGGSNIPQRNRLGPPDPPKRLPSYPSTESGGGSPVRNWDSPLKLHPPLPPKPTKIPPPPPPRISSKSPLVSPSIESSGGDSSESVNSQDGGAPNSKLSQRHQELLRKQRQLQEQYNRLQMLQQRGPGSNSVNSNNSDKAELKKTGSESNLRAKLGLEFSAAPTGSLSNINKPLYETDIL